MKPYLTFLSGLFLLLMLTLTPDAKAQGGTSPPEPVGSGLLQPSLRFSHLTTADGLANSHIHVMFQDSRGFMWIGTRDGLSRYDGYRFTTFRHDPDNPNSLSGNTISDIIEDDQGRLWITASGGVTILDPQLERFSPLQLDLPGRVLTLFQDSQGLIWLGTLNGQLLRIDPTTQRINRYPLTTDEAPGSPNSVWDIIEDRAGELWLAASSALVKFDPESERVTRYEPPDNPGEIRALYEDEAGQIWFDGLTLHKLDPTTESITTFQSPLGPVPIVDTMVDQHRQLWLATLVGLFRFDLQSEQFIDHITHHPPNPSSLSSNRTFSLFEDKSGVTWVGTTNAGLSLFDPRQTQFTNYQPTIANAPNLGAVRVSSVIGDASGTLWLGTETYLNRFNPVTGEIDQFTPAEATSPGPLGISALHEDSSGQIWFGLVNQLYRFDPKQTQFMRYDLPGRVGGPPNPLTAIFQDEAGLLWLGRQRGGFAQFNPQTETFHPLPNQIDEVHTIYRDPTGVLWLAGSRMLSHFDPKNDVLETYQAPYGPVNALYQDQNDQVWVGANDGLYRFEPASASFTRYTDRDGLPSSAVLTILPDQLGNLWLSTQQGLTRFAPQTETFRTYDVADGLQDNKFIMGSAWQAPDGQLYFGGEQGLTVFYPDQISDNPYNPPLVLTEVRLFNEPLPISDDSPLPQAINFNEQLSFNYDQNIISFEFAALSYAAPHKNRYRFRLEGFEEEWNEVDSTRRFATYTNLPAGAYIFQVQGTNNSGLWSTNEVALPVVITPPWWETIWFRAVVLVGLIGLIYGGYRWRVRAIEQRNRELASQVAARTQELADSEMRFRGLSSSTYEAIIIHDETEILDVNQAATEIFDYTQSELIGQPIDRLLAPESPPLGGDTEQLYEVEGRTKHGVTIPLEVRTKTIPYQGRQACVAAMRDLTDRRELETQKLRLAAMDERERIGRDLHDDLGQVMGYVSVQAQATRELLNHQQLDQAKATLNQLIEAANEAHHEVRQYILGVRTEALTPLNFFDELQRYLHQLQERYNLKVQLSWPPTLTESPLSHEVETQLLRIIQEALTNIRKHAGVETARIFVTLTPEEMQVMVVDEGRGFEKQEVDGNDAESDPQSGSFGLEIMRERAEGVGGHLEVRSKPGAGTEVIIRLPRLLEMPAEKQIKGLRVLVVDDHPLYLEGLRNLLSTRGVQVVGTAQDGLEAQELADQFQPDLILMDVEMPRCDGLEATRQIKSKHPDVKIVMLTVAAEDETLFEALKHGASGYLLKNLDARQFFTLLTDVMRGETVLSPTLAAQVLEAF